MNLIKDMSKMDFKWILWALALICANIGGGIYFLDTLEGVLAVLFMLIGQVLMVYLHKNYGLTRILGLSHILWIYLVPHFIFVYIGLKPSHFKGWLFLVAVLNGISVIIDTANAIRYYLGDKESLLQ